MNQKRGRRARNPGPINQHVQTLMNLQRLKKHTQGLHGSAPEENVLNLLTLHELIGEETHILLYMLYHTYLL